VNFDKPKYWLVARDKPGLLIAMMRSLVGNAHISFEGNLSNCGRLAEIPGSTTNETHSLKRATLHPRQDFIVVPLESDTTDRILDQILPDARVIRDIIHIQIPKDGQLAFGSYDNFHPDCISTWSAVPDGLLDTLFKNGVLRSYELATDNST
jgi:hypothetical protein